MFTPEFSFETQKQLVTNLLSPMQSRNFYNQLSLWSMVVQVHIKNLALCLNNVCLIQLQKKYRQPANQLDSSPASVVEATLQF